MKRYFLFCPHWKDLNNMYFHMTLHTMDLISGRYLCLFLISIKAYSLMSSLYFKMCFVSPAMIPLQLYFIDKI